METKVKRTYLVLLLVPSEVYAIFKVIFEGVKTLEMVQRKTGRRNIIPCLLFQCLNAKSIMILSRFP